VKSTNHGAPHCVISVNLHQLVPNTSSAPWSTI